MLGFGQTDPVRKQGGVQRSSGPVLATASEPSRTGYELDLACLLGEVCCGFRVGVGRGEGRDVSVREVWCVFVSVVKGKLRRMNVCVCVCVYVCVCVCVCVVCVVCVCVLSLIHI